MIDTFISKAFDLASQYLPDKAQQAKFMHELSKMKLEADMAQAKQQSDERLAQAATNTAEATHGDPWAKGWRPLFGYIGALALGYNYIGLPIIETIAQFREIPFIPPVVAMEEIHWLIGGMLGLSGWREVAKARGQTK